MSVLWTVCLSLVAYFLNQIHHGVLASLSPGNNDQAIITPSAFEKGHGPQISLTSGFKGDHTYYWDSEIPIQNGPVVVFADSQLQPLYNITQDPNAQRGFIIKHHNQTLLVATDKKKAHCAFRYTYHTGYNVSYAVRSRSRRWTMTLYGENDVETQFNYRFHKHNRGTVNFSENGTFAASFTWQDQTTSNLPFARMILTIGNSTNVEPAKFVGLWVLAQKRKKRCDWS